MIWGLGDEPIPEEYEAFRKRSEQIWKAVPDLEVFMSGFPNPKLYGALNVWLSFLMTENWEFNRECQRRGEEVWWCRCGVVKINEYRRPAYEYPCDVCIDTESINVRILYLMGFKYGVDGFSFWAGNFWPTRSKEDRAWLNWKPGDVWPCTASRNRPPWAGVNNGDGYVVYPGRDGPLPSIRLKVMRDGIEDYEYLHILRSLGEQAANRRWRSEIEAALRIPADLIVSTRVYSKAPEDLLRYRQKIGALIDRICSAFLP